MEKTNAPAVFSAREALKKALSMKSFMHEKILAGQYQSKINEELRQQKLEQDRQMKEDMANQERKIAEKVAKDNKEKQTSELTKLLGK